MQSAEYYDHRKFGRYIRDIHDSRHISKAGECALLAEVFHKSVEDYVSLVFYGIIIHGELNPEYELWPTKPVGRWRQPKKFCGYTSPADVRELLEFIFGPEFGIYMDYAGIESLEPFTIQHQLRNMTRETVLRNMVRNGYQNKGDGTYRKTVHFDSGDSVRTEELVRDSNGALICARPKRELNAEQQVMA